MKKKFKYEPQESTPIVESYPELLPVFKEVVEWQARYIVWLYSKDSPLIREVVDIAARKERALSLTGLDMEGRDPGGLLTELDNKDVQEAIFRFLKHQDSRLWAMIVTNESVFDQYTRQLLIIGEIDAITKDELQKMQIKGKLMEEMEKINTRLGKYYKEFFGDYQQELLPLKPKRVTPESVSDNVQRDSGRQDN